MRNDQIFVLMLVILLPMSGCFDGAVGDAEGTDDSSSGTTVINNYYNNTTSLMEANVIYSTGDVEVFDYGNTSATYPSAMVFSLTTTAGEMVRVVQGQLDGVVNGGQYVMYTNCTEGASFYTGIPKDYTEHIGDLPGSFDTCEHELIVRGVNDYQGNQSFSWSFSYQIIAVTVV